MGQTGDLPKVELLDVDGQRCSAGHLFFQQLQQCCRGFQVLHKVGRLYGR